MYLFFDTETTGIPKNWKAPVTDLDNWPRLVQIAWLLYDNEQNLIEEKNYIIRPEGYSIPYEATQIHKISTDIASATGNDLTRVLKEFSLIIEKAQTIIAHNLSFDEKIVGAEFIRKSVGNSLSSKKKICTMEETTNFCAIPGNYGYKWPKLSELYYKLFNRELEEAHNASVDIKATAKCFWELKRQGLIDSNKIDYYPPEKIVKENTNQSLHKEIDKTVVQDYSIQNFQYAGFGLRFFAWFIDFAMWFIITSIIWAILGLPIPDNAMGPIMGGFYIFNNPFGWLIGWLYYGIMESGSNQASVGKMAVGIKVTDLNGERVSFGKASGRFFGKIISGIILGIGYLMILFTAKRQGLHDQMANCLVLKK